MNQLFPKGRDMFDKANEMFNQTLGSLEFNRDFDIDIEDNKTAYKVHVDLPGVKQEDINLDYANDTLLLRARRVENMEEFNTERNFVRRERSFGSFSRSIYLPNVDEQTIKAVYKKDGTLVIELPKKEVMDTPKSSIPIDSEL